MLDNEKLTIEAAASYLECSERKLMEMLHAGALPGLQLGRSWVIPRQAFVTAVNQLALDSAAAVRLMNTPQAAAPAPRLGRPRLERAA